MIMTKGFLMAVIVVIGLVVTGYFFFQQKPALSLEASVSPSVSVTSTAVTTPMTSVESKTLYQNTSHPQFEVLTKEFYTATIQSQRGNIVVKLYAKVAPTTVANFITLAKLGFYDNLKFHRVVPDFVIQGGDPFSKNDDPLVGSGGPGYKFEDEINPRTLGVSAETIKKYLTAGYTYNYTLNSMPVKVGALAMANSGPNTNGSQFFIVTNTDQPSLNGLHTVFGSVIKGMDVVRAMQQGDVIKTITIE